MLDYLATTPMNIDVSGLLLLGLGLTLLLAGLSLFLLRDARQMAGGLGTGTRFFLVALRLAIGWHFVVEGLDKINAGTWSSEGYLRESTGPLAPVFRDLAGDRLIDKLTLESDGSFPTELGIYWSAYLNAFDSFYGLDAAQLDRAKVQLDQVKQGLAKTWLSAQPRLVDKPSPDPAQPPIKAAMTMPERLKFHEVLEARVREIEEVQRPEYGPQTFEKLRHAKANLNRWRAGLQRDVGLMNKEMQGALRMLLLKFAEESLAAGDRKKIQETQQAIEKEREKERKEGKERPHADDWEGVVRYKEKWEDKLVVAYRGIYNDLRWKEPRAELDPLTARIVANVFEKKSKHLDPYDPLPFRVGRPVGEWALLDWSDWIVKWGITVVGFCLLAGLLTRLACVAGAGFLLMFFLAMPPLPGWPDSPRAEGHYLFINKNVIEMLALLTLATTASGRWVGLDGLLQILCPCGWKTPTPSANLEAGERIEKLTDEPTVTIKPPA